jgi:hypothetical protein
MLGEATSAKALEVKQCSLWKENMQLSWLKMDEVDRCHLCLVLSRFVKCTAAGNGWPCFFHSHFCIFNTVREKDGNFKRYHTSEGSPRVL